MKRNLKRFFTKISLICFVSVVVCLAYCGEFDGIAVWFASKLDREWDISPPHTIYVYDPLWACDDECPPFVIVEIEGKKAPELIGKSIRLFQKKRNLFKHGGMLDRFFMCRGQMKKSLYVYTWEYLFILREGDPKHNSATGEFFDVEYCENKVPSHEQYESIENVMKQYTESEGED